MSKRTVYILGAGFSRAIGICSYDGKEFVPPLDVDFFHILEQEGLLSNFLSDKPCLRHLLEWMTIYDKNKGKLTRTSFSLEEFWSRILFMLKLNSSISGFPDFELLPTRRETLNGTEVEHLPNIHGWSSVMPDDEKSLYSFVSKSTDNFFNYEGLILYFADYEIEKAIFQVYSEIDYPSKKESVINRFREIVGDSPIISFNYDCLAERIFDKHSLFHYDERHSLHNVDSIILKPHGSLGWVVTKKFSQDNGAISIDDRTIKREVEKSSFASTNLSDNELVNKTPIIIPMSPGKENFVSSIDSARMEIWNKDEFNKKREFIDCVVSYAKMFEIIRNAERVVFIGYSFPATDYESINLLNLAFRNSLNKECHICIKGRKVPRPEISCSRLFYYKRGFEQFLKEFV